MGVTIRYELDGRSVSRDQFFDGIEGQVRLAVVEEVRGKLERVRCTEHGQPPTVEVRETRNGFEFGITGCCDKLVAGAQAALR